MKTSIITIGVLLMVTCCETNNSISTDKINEMKVSQKKWDKLKAKNDNSYRYSISSQSWTGYGTITEIKVVNGIVVERKHNEYVINQLTGQLDMTPVYREDQSQLGLNDAGAPPLIFDELYNSCRVEYLKVNTQDNNVYFETSDIGLMTTCGYFPKNCSDDCFRGISIKTFEWL
jgi:hypothetical protein